VRTKNQILKDGTRKEDLMIEVLLDIRDTLIKATKKKKVVGADSKRLLK